MSESTVYYPISNDGPLTLTRGSTTCGTILPSVAQSMAAMDAEIQAKYKVDSKKNQTGENKNMGRKKSK
jgi:hypothetical protein